MSVGVSGGLFGECLWGVWGVSGGCLVDAGPSEFVQLYKVWITRGFRSHQNIGLVIMVKSIS